MPSPQNFVNFARQAPYMSELEEYTCHMAVMHWMFMNMFAADFTLPDQLPRKANCIVMFLKDTLNRTKGIKHKHINPIVYGDYFCSYRIQVYDCDHLYNQVHKGDVLIVGEPNSPMHSMVVVSKIEKYLEEKGYRVLDRKVYIRGFNNAGTFGINLAPQMEYDDNDRDVYNPRNPLLSGTGGQDPFWGDKGVFRRLFIIRYEHYYEHCKKIYDALHNLHVGLILNGKKGLGEFLTGF